MALAIIIPTPKVQATQVSLSKLPNEIVLSEKLPNDGIMTIKAGNLGYYAIDTRFNLCFLVTPEVTIQVPCGPFGIAFGGKL
jgi:hypothetical protein